MKTYIIFTCEIHPIGGTQAYTSTKAKFLKDNGWNVVVFFEGPKTKGCKIEYLDKYVDGGFTFLEYRPGNFDKKSVEKYLDLLESRLTLTKDSNEEILIESHAGTLCLWAELLAERIGAKHIIFNCNETFRDPGKCYVEYIDYFKYKYDKNELYGVNNTSLHNLFDGYYDIPISEDKTFIALENPDVNDIFNKKVHEITKKDLNIAYVGRTEKDYVEKIIYDLYDFCNKYNDKHIQIIIVGDAKYRKKLLKSTLYKCSNVDVVLLGDLVPIPNELFEKLDVIIAGSGSALAVAYADVPVIVPNMDTYLACGVLGYTTNDALVGDVLNQTSYVTALEKTLFEKEYKNYDFTLEKRPTPLDVFSKHLEFFENIDGEGYYNTYKPEIENKMSFIKYNYYKIRHFIYGIYRKFK